MAGAPSAWTPMTRVPGFTALATIAAPITPLPPPTGTKTVSRSGAASNSSRDAVATPAISSGSIDAEWM